MRRGLFAVLAGTLLLSACGGAQRSHAVTHPQRRQQVQRSQAVQPASAASLPPYSAILFRSTFPQRPALLSVRMNSQSAGWAILQLLHGTAVAHTTDGGATWTTLLVTASSAVQVDSPAPATVFVLENSCSQGDCKATTVQATFDAGRTWQTIFQSSRFAGTSISFPSETVGFIAGSLAGTAASTGALYATTTSGLSWTLRSTPCAFQGPNAQAISFLGAGQGFLMCGGNPGAGEQPKAFYQTQDGGHSWSMISAAEGTVASANGLPLSGYIHSMFFLSTETGFIGLDRGGIYMTRDGGIDWQAVFGSPLPTASGQAFSVGFSDPEHGWLLAGDGPPLYTTADGGLTWQLVYPPLSPSTAISFLSPQLGYAAGWTYDGATVLRTTDGGASWTAVGEAPVSLSALEVLGPSELIALGQADLYVSLDGGRTWQVQPFAHGWYPAALGMENTQRGWVIGYSLAAGRQLFYTGDAGLAWQALPTPFAPSAVVPLGGQDVLATGTPTVAKIYLNPDRQGRTATSLKSQTPYLWRSTDRGLHWTPISLPHWRPQQGAPVGMRVGTGGLVWLWSGSTIWLSRDGGTTFRRIGFRQLGGLGDVSFTDAQDGWLLTTAGALYATGDGGLTWQEIASSVSF